MVLKLPTPSFWVDFCARSMGGEVPAGPQSANLHWLVIATVVVLAVIGLIYLFRTVDKT